MKTNRMKTATPETTRVVSSFKSTIALLALCALAFACPTSWAQVSITSLGAAFTQNFDGMGSSATATLPTGFKIGTDWSSGTTATTLAYGTTGTGAVTGTSGGGVINWANGITASATDRSLGFLNTGTFTSPRSIVYAFVNNSGSTITSLTIAFDYEKSRSGSRQFDWTFFHGGTSTPTTAATGGDQSYAADANNTTILNPPTTTSKSFTITGLSIANGATYYLKWTFTGLGGSSNGQGIGLDNFSITASGSAPTAPTATAATSVTSTGFNANWNSSSGATGYRLDVSTASDFSSFVSGYNDFNVGNVTTYAVSGLSASTAYHYRVRAYNGVGTSGNSSTIDVTTTVGGVPKILVTLPGEASPNAGGATAQTAGTAFNITLTTTTDGTTIDTSYSGSKSITFSGPTGSPTYPGTVSFSSGVGTANITLTKTETIAITATDGTIAGIASSSLLVNPGAVASYVVAATSPQTVGIAFAVTVTAKDANNNTVTTDSSTSVTMGSGSGNVSFDVNPKTLSSGAFTVNATDNTAETTTITATDGSNNGVSGNIVVNPVPKYQSKTSGNWNDFSTWQVDVGSGFVDATASQTPTSADDTIEIQNGHVVTVTAAVSVDQVVIKSGGQITLNSGVTLTVNNGSGDDIVVQNGGIFVLTANPSFSSGSTAKINTGGVLKVAATGLTANNAGVNAANFVYQDASILDYTLTSSFSASGVTFFPGVAANTVPIFRLSGVLGVNTPGGGSATVINGVFEVVTGNAITWTGAGIKTFRNGIRGAGSVSQSTAGPFVISGATAELGGGTLTLGASGVLITNGSVVTLSSDKTLAGTGALTNTGTLVLNGKTLTAAIAPVFNGTNISEIDRNGGSPLAGKIVVSSGTQTYGGVLTVTNIGATLTGGEVFDLFDAPSFTGAFTLTNLPSLGAGLNWWTGSLTNNGTLVVNRAPVATNDVASTTLGATITLASFKLVANDSDLDGDSLAITNAIATSGSASIVDGNIQYTAPVSGSSDTIIYTVSDGRGGTNIGTVTVTLTSANAGSLNVLNQTLNGINPQLTFAGVANVVYAVDHATGVSGPWTEVTQFTFPSGVGTYVFTDTATDGTTGSHFYRTRYVSGP